MRKFLSIVFLIPLIASLANTPVFGNPSLAALFFYILFIAATAVIVFISSLTSSKLPIKLPFYLSFFLLFVVYVFLHGYFTKTIGLSQYYWIANGLLVTACYFQFVKYPRYLINVIYKGITVVPLFERVVVLLQCLNILPVRNNYFLCTGTWVNPNVTAIFLSFSLFAVLHVFKSINKLWLTNTLLVVVSSILLLYCRTAHLLALLFLLGYFKIPVRNFFQNKFHFNVNTIAVITVIIIELMVFLLPFFNKQQSMQAREDIWQNSIHLAIQNPMTGYGFGRFEKEYNLLAASPVYRYPGIRVFKMIHTHPNFGYKCFSGQDFYGMSPFFRHPLYKQITSQYVIAYDTSMFAMAIEDSLLYDNFINAFPYDSVKDGNAAFDQTKTIGAAYFDVYKKLATSMGFGGTLNDDDADTQAQAFILSKFNTGLVMYRKRKNETNFKKINTSISKDAAVNDVYATFNCL